MIVMLYFCSILLNNFSILSAFMKKIWFYSVLLLLDKKRKEKFIRLLVAIWLSISIGESTWKRRLFSTGELLITWDELTGKFGTNMRIMLAIASGAIKNDWWVKSTLIANCSRTEIRRVVRQLRSGDSFIILFKAIVSQISPKRNWIKKREELYWR